MNSYIMDGDVSYQFKAISIKILVAMCTCMCVDCQANSKISTEKKTKNNGSTEQWSERTYLILYQAL